MKNISKYYDKKNIFLSIITLSKNDNDKFIKTLKSIKSQKIDFKIEWIIIDGSNNKNQENKIKLIKKTYYANRKYISIDHINSQKMALNGIYPCMNYGKEIANGKFIIFLNSGDIFYDNFSLQILFKNSKDLNPYNSLVFGQAKIIASNKINWLFPGKRLKNIDKWLRFFEPNHQSMMISKKLSNSYDFPLKYSYISDGYWKRLIIKKANNIIYINKPLIIFFLDGVSSTKPSKKVLIEIINNKEIFFIRKCIFIIKYLIPKKLFIIYHLLQKYKSFMMDLIL